MTSLLVVLVACLLTVVSFKGLQMSTDSELKLRSGDTVECDQASPILVVAWRVEETTNSNDVDHQASSIQLKQVEEREIESLKQATNAFYDDYPLVTETTKRFSIPHGSYIFPYLMAPSNITVSVCLKGNSTALNSNNATLVIFKNQTLLTEFIENATSSAAVFSVLLNISNEGKKNCYEETYSITEDAYYYVALEVPGGVTVENNITLDVVYIDGSELTEKENCVVDANNTCHVNLNSWTHKRVLLCYKPHPAGSHTLSNITVTRIFRFNFFATKLFASIGFFIALVLFGIEIVLYFKLCFKKFKNKM